MIFAGSQAVRSGIIDRFRCIELHAIRVAEMPVQICVSVRIIMRDIPGCVIYRAGCFLPLIEELRSDRQQACCLPITHELLESLERIDCRSLCYDLRKHPNVPGDPFDLLQGFFSSYFSHSRLFLSLFVIHLHEITVFVQVKA